MTASTRKTAFFIVLVAVAYLAYTFVIKPANKNLAKTKIGIEKDMTKLYDLEQAAIAAEDVSKQLDELEDAIKFFESRLPPDSEIHKVLKQVTVIAQKQGLVPKTIRTLKAKNCNGYIEQPLKMELNGDFDSYYSFLLELEKMPRITKIRQLELEKTAKTEGQTKASFIVSIFFQDTNKG